MFIKMRIRLTYVLLRQFIGLQILKLDYACDLKKKNKIILCHTKLDEMSFIHNCLRRLQSSNYLLLCSLRQNGLICVTKGF